MPLETVEGRQRIYQGPYEHILHGKHSGGPRVRRTKVETGGGAAGSEPVSVSSFQFHHVYLILESRFLEMIGAAELAGRSLAGPRREPVRDQIFSFS